MLADHPPTAQNPAEPNPVGSDPKPVWTKTLGGGIPITLTLYGPTLTWRQADGPETQLTNTDVDALYDMFEDVRWYLKTGDPTNLT